jgi:aspartate-semialdehyde dehydrogenase
MQKNISIIGATGNVGRKILEIILEKNVFPASAIKLFASAASAGKELTMNHHTYRVEDAAKYDFQNSALCIFSTESEISEQYIPTALEAGCIVIDTSSLYRLDPSIPLIVAPVNKHLISIHNSRLYAVANCLASPTSIALAPLQKKWGIKRVNVITYQSVSGAGKQAMDELHQETSSLINKQSFQRSYFKRQIAFNVIPQVGEILADGFTHEEFKIIKEIQKIIADDFPVTATAVRVPVMVGHSIALSIELNKTFDLSDIKQALREYNGLQLSEDNYTTPVEAHGSDKVFVGRIRKDPTIVNGLHLWLCSDNLRRGAATDTVEIVQEVLNQLS